MTRPCFASHNSKEVLFCELCDEKEKCYEKYNRLFPFDEKQGRRVSLAMKE